LQTCCNDIAHHQKDVNRIKISKLHTEKQQYVTVCSPFKD